jgi:hypothetical protein
MAWLEQERAYSCSTKYHVLVPVHPLVRLWQIVFLNEMIHFAIWQFSHKNLKVTKSLFFLLTSYREKNVKYIIKPKRKKGKGILYYGTSRSRNICEKYKLSLQTLYQLKIVQNNRISKNISFQVNQLI